MKTIIRTGVFETNSSSTHSMVLLGKDEVDAAIKKKPSLARYATLADMKDKLFMACGCCYEMYSSAKERDRTYSYEDLKKHGDDSAFFYAYYRDISYDTATEFLIGVYCELTGADFAALRAEIDRENKSGRACHMRFFEEGALYDEFCDYDEIADLFDGCAEDVIERITQYFCDDNVLLYREYWNGMGYREDRELDETQGEPDDL